MVVTLHKSGDTFSFRLPPQSEEALALVDGSTVEIKPAEETPTIRYASVKEVMDIHHKMEPRHAEAYRELAK